MTRGIKNPLRDWPSRSKEYSSWQLMKRRCLNPNDSSFWRYGGRGIGVCAGWLVFSNFVRDMGPRPKGTTIDRIDNARGYEPGNCRWATWMEQGRNKTTNRRISYAGREWVLGDLAEHAGIRHATLSARLDEGWSVDDAVETPVRNWGRHGPPLALSVLAEVREAVRAGETYRSISRRLGISHPMARRVSMGGDR